MPVEIEQTDAGDSRFERVDPGKGGEIVCDRIGRAHHGDRDIRHARRVVITVACALERVVHAGGHHEQRHTARKHTRHRDRLRAQSTQVAQQLAVQWAKTDHQCSSLGGMRFGLSSIVRISPSAKRTTRSPMRGDVRVVRDQQRGGVKLLVRGDDGFEHVHARGHIQRARGLVTQKHRRALRDGARDGDALLLATRELRGEMMQAGAETDQLERLLRRHGRGRRSR